MKPAQNPATSMPISDRELTWAEITRSNSVTLVDRKSDYFLRDLTKMLLDADPPFRISPERLNQFIFEKDGKVALFKDGGRPTVIALFNVDEDLTIRRIEVARGEDVASHLKEMIGYLLNSPESAAPVATIKVCEENLPLLIALREAEFKVTRTDKNYYNRGDRIFRDRYTMTRESQD